MYSVTLRQFLPYNLIASMNFLCSSGVQIFIPPFDLVLDSDFSFLLFESSSDFDSFSSIEDKVILLAGPKESFA